MADLQKPDIGELIRKGLIQPKMRNVRAKQTFDSAWDNTTEFYKKRFIEAVKSGDKARISKANTALFTAANQRIKSRDPEFVEKRKAKRRVDSEKKRTGGSNWV